MRTQVRRIGNHQTSGPIQPAALLECGHIVLGDSFSVGQDVDCDACETEESGNSYETVSSIWTPITRNELLSILQRLQKSPQGDGHGEADQALLDYINDAEIRKAFLAIGRYYD